MLFAYRAINASGRCQTGRIEATNAVDLENRLKSMGLTLIRGRPTKPPMLLFRRPTPRRELINFCFHLEQLIRAGIPVLAGLADLRDAIEERRFRETVASLHSRIEGGETLSGALAAHADSFNPVFINLIRAGEHSGRLPEVLADLCASLKWEDELAAHTRKLLLYPAFVATIVGTVTIFLMIFLVPQLKLFVKSMGYLLPAHTQLLFAVSDLLAQHGLLALLLLLLPVAVAPWLMKRHPTLPALIDSLQLRLPILGPLLRKIILARLAGLLAMLYAAGIPFLDAIGLARGAAGNRAIARALYGVEDGIRNGHGITAAFRDAALFPGLILRMLHIGETTGGLDTALRNVAYFYHRDVRESADKAQTLIEPLLTLFMGVLLGWIMLSVIGPIYDVISRLKP